MSIKTTLAATAAALAIATAPLPMAAAPVTTASANAFTITYEAAGQISGTVEDFAFADEITATVAGSVELADLAQAILGHKKLHDTKTKKITVWLDRAELAGDTLIVRGGGRYEKRMKLLFGGWMKLFSQSGSVELRLKLGVSDGRPVVHVVGTRVDLGGLLGDVVRLFDVDRSIERRIAPRIQTEIDARIGAALPDRLGTMGTLRFDELSFAEIGGAGSLGVRFAAQATLALGT